jgi:hypothetical protein
VRLEADFFEICALFAAATFDEFMPRISMVIIATGAQKLNE